MTTKKETHRCALCTQTSSRPWNLMVHIDRKHPEIGGEANPIRQAKNLSNHSNHSKRNTNHDLSRIVPGWGHHMIGNNPYVSGVPNLRTVNSSATPFYNTPIESLLRRYEEDKQEELEVKRRESQRISIHESIEEYQTAIKIKESENRKRMEGNLGLDIINYISSQMAAGRLTPVVTIAREGTISIRYEPTNTENDVKHIAANKNDLSDPQFQDMLAILATAHTKSLENIIKIIEVMKRRLDAKDEELAHVLAGRVKVSQANDSRAEQSRIEEKPKVVSGILSRVEEKNDNRYNGEDEKTFQKETGKVDFDDLCSSNCEMSPHKTPPLARPLPTDSAWFHSESPASHKLSKKLEPLWQENRQEVKQECLPDQYFGRLPLPQEQTSSFRGYEVQQGPPTDEEIKKEIEEAANMQMRRIQEDQERENRPDEL